MFGALATGLILHRLSSCCDAGHGTLLNLHASLGLTVLGLVGTRVVARTIWRWPALPANTPLLQSLLARGVHTALYVLMIALPLVGWNVVSVSGCCQVSPFVFNLFTLPSLNPPPIPSWSAAFALHSALAWIVMGAIGLHAAAAFLHHFVFKDDILARVVLGLRAMRSRDR